MASLNCVSLVGRTGRDPDVRHLDDGKVVTKFSLAVQRWDGVTTDWIDCEAWGKTAVVIGDYVTCGQLIGVTGRLAQEKWVNNNGQNRSRHVVKVSDVMLMPKALGKEEPASESQTLGDQYPPSDPQGRQKYIALPVPAGTESDYDAPF